MTCRVIVRCSAVHVCTNVCLLADPELIELSLSHSASRFRPLRRTLQTSDWCQLDLTWPPTAAASMPPRRWKKPPSGRKGSDTDSHEGGHEYGASSGQQQGQAAPEQPSYVLFDGREDCLLYWMELKKEEKEELLHVEEDELGASLARATLGPDAGARSLAIAPQKMQELTQNGELMTAARLVFIDGVYEEGKVKSMSDPTAPASAEAASLDLILHSILGVVERHVLLSLERSTFYMRLLAVLLFWIWSWVLWPWWVRYPLIILIAASTVAAAAAAQSLQSAAASTSPEELAKLGPRWALIGRTFIRAKDLLILPFDSPRGSNGNGSGSGNPVLLRCRTDIFLASLLVLDHASWVSWGRYWFVFFFALVLPTIILSLDNGSGGWNKSGAQFTLMRNNGGASAVSEGARGKRMLRHLSLGLSCCLAIYYASSTWLSTIFVAAIFFPSFTTIVLSTSGIALTGSALALNKIQEALLGDYAPRRFIYWAVWVVSMVSFWSGWGTNGGWILWLCTWATVLLLVPPPISFAIQLAGGGLVSLLLSVGLATAAKFLVKMAQLLLTKEGMVAGGQLMQGQCFLYLSLSANLGWALLLYARGIVLTLTVFFSLSLSFPSFSLPLCVCGAALCVAFLQVVRDLYRAGVAGFREGMAEGAAAGAEAATAAPAAGDGQKQTQQSSATPEDSGASEMN